jgi:hypothetical protein
MVFLAQDCAQVLLVLVVMMEEEVVGRGDGVLMEEVVI